MNTIHKYPRTQHLEGSRLQPGDEDIEHVRFLEVAGKHLVIEEKLDGANCGVSFDRNGELLLQSRGHYLTGGYAERHFDLLKVWARTHQRDLFEHLGARYVMYGEWTYAKHTVFYDTLPHYFHEFDILDTSTGEFLGTYERRQLLCGLPVVAVPVVAEGEFQKLDELTELVGQSRYKGSSWRDSLAKAAIQAGQDPERISKETDPSDDMEGLYVKHEEGGRVAGRYKWIRASFLTCVLDSGNHWLDRPIVPNRLADDVDIFEVSP